MEAEPDSDQEQDIDQVLGAWLGELENMTKQMDAEVIDVNLPTSPLPQPSYDILDNFRFSQFNLETQVSIGGSSDGAAKCLQSLEEEDTQDVDLDALLGDLCEMEQSLQEQISKGPQPTTQVEAVSTVSDPMSPESSATRPPPPPLPPPPPPPPADDDTIDADFNDDLPPPPPDDDPSIECGTAPLPPPPPDMDETHTDESVTQSSAPPPPPPPPPPPMPPSESKTEGNSKQVPESLSLISPSNSTTTVSESTHDGTGSPDSTRTTSTQSAQSPIQSPKQGPIVEVTPSSPARAVLSPKAPVSPSFQSQPANLSKSVRVKLKEIEDQLESDPSLTEEERQAKIKAEKIKIALEKLKKANIQKLIVRVYTDDGGSKTVFLDETMSCRMATSMMVEKNHLEYKPDLCILEQIPDLYMERIVEDHESLINDVLINWKRETTNRVLFSERKEKYAIFRNPQNYLLSSSSSQAAHEFAEKSKEVLIKEFFADTGSQVPEVDGVLWMKAEGKKSWKRFYFILRASGLYFSPKGKSKVEY
ncbi:Ras-associated and pleckstrin-likey domains-containing protein 1 [Holothuria leucospilota]|uniref:Ras-associated and pleckstrin-likey domains-containing protein 1 n=1 Tax=Holothuria leucospilota TaxID=206669 RepID=A0A9Q0YPG1_HOLLE|nr:Ras-associated and pleckstrin-likey domains-containing protein 1 [Holothuria leucospilota]